MNPAHSVATCRAFPKSWLAWAFVLACLMGLFSSPVFAASQAGKGFDHARTGFQLNGAHRNERCESCHTQGIFKGTPTQCASCHASSGQRASSSIMPAKHIPTTRACDNCHNTTTFSGARFNHTGVAPGTCSTCHNGNITTGKPSTHIATTAACDSCHKTSAWTPAIFNHSGVARGTCATCHKNKPTSHIPTTQSCDSCHRTNAWTPAIFSHSGVAPGTCATCH
ncbi:cytochrome c3 family protein, partial [Thiobacillus sp.]|uniref:cytochrome c3 family protein n=1 Tax=Thiobacillus sp. TaxID=924 RepID=UPI00286DD422